MTIKPLIDYFNNHLPLNEEEKSLVEELFKERRVKRKQFILQEGDISKLNTFVVEGCFRMYMVDGNGKVDLQQKVGQLIARFKQLHFGYTFLFQIR